MADGGYLGAGGRLAGGPADELVEAAYAHELRAAPRLAYDLSLSDIALGKEEIGRLAGAFPLNAAAGTRYPEKQLAGLGI